MPAKPTKVEGTLRTTTFDARVFVNGILLSPKEAILRVRSFVTPAFFRIISEDFLHINAAGTALGVSIRNRYFQITARHIAENLGYDHEQLVLNFQNEDGAWTSVNASSVHGVLNPSAPQLADFLIAEFTSLNALAKRRFLQIDESFFLPPEERKTFYYDSIVLIGYPREFAEGIWNGDDQIGWHLKGPLVHNVEPKEHDAFDDALLEAIRSANDPEIIDPDGLSGSPILIVHIDKAGRYSFKLWGIVTMSNQKGTSFNLVPSGIIMRRLLDLLDEVGRS